MIDVAAHLGSLLAVLFYFRSDLGKLLAHVLTPGGSPDENSEGKNLAWLLLWAHRSDIDRRTVCPYLCRSAQPQCNRNCAGLHIFWLIAVAGRLAW